MAKSKTPADQREQLLADAQAMVDFYRDEPLMNTVVGPILTMVERLIDLNLEPKK